MSLPTDLQQAVAFIKSQQDLHSPPRLKTKSEQIAYQKTGRKPPGRKSFVDKMFEQRQALELGAVAK